GICFLLAGLGAAAGLPAPVLTPAVAVITFAAVTSVAVIASLLPALRVRRMEVAAALRCAL
ncbi:MAG: hypothetical protein HKP30_12320, partial [Myxococcales bacterium]|nr:hypothetical protein [Myxococcales bacterium]